MHANVVNLPSPNFKNVHHSPSVCALASGRRKRKLVHGILEVDCNYLKKVAPVIKKVAPAMRKVVTLKKPALVVKKQAPLVKTAAPNMKPNSKLLL